MPSIIHHSCRAPHRSPLRPPRRPPTLPQIFVSFTTVKLIPALLNTRRANNPCLPPGQGTLPMPQPGTISPGVRGSPCSPGEINNALLERPPGYLSIKVPGMTERKPQNNAISYLFFPVPCMHHKILRTCVHVLPPFLPESEKPRALSPGHRSTSLNAIGRHARATVGDRSLHVTASDEV